MSTLGFIKALLVCLQLDDDLANYFQYSLRKFCQKCESYAQKRGCLLSCANRENPTTFIKLLRGLVRVVKLSQMYNCLQSDGAGLVFTSATQEINCGLLQQYLLRLMYPHLLKRHLPKPEVG